MKLSDLGEGGLIGLIRDWTSSRPPVVVGVGDDAAVLEIGADKDLVISTDASVEDVHFRTGSLAADEIGHRAMAAALSDLAAMGATGIAALVGLHAPPDASVEFVHGLYRGMERVAAPAGVQIAGGNTARGPLSLDITVVGWVPRGGAVLRSGAREGDALFVSGTLGRSEAGRRLLSGEPAPGVPARARREAQALHRAPQPRFDVAGLLMGLPRRPTAMIDVSDGLARDLGHVCERSGVGAVLYEERIPIAAAARGSLDRALHDGEDYELLYTIPRPRGRVIGEIVGGRGLWLRRRDGRKERLEPRGWEHR